MEHRIKECDALGMGQQTMTGSDNRKGPAVVSIVLVRES